MCICSCKQSNSDSELVGQHLLSINGQDVSKLGLKDVMEVFKTCAKPITLIFEEPLAGGKMGTSEVHWDGVSPLGIHLANHTSGKGVTVESLAETCQHADESHIGQHLVSVNGVDTTHMNLTVRNPPHSCIYLRSCAWSPIHSPISLTVRRTS